MIDGSATVLHPIFTLFGVTMTPITGILILFALAFFTWACKHDIKH